VGNTISNNGGFGIFLGYIEYPGKDNIIYHNNFINNDFNAKDKCNNIWDDGKYGNYWSDYRFKYPFARRIWSKGIWDTPYEITGGSNKDGCPLIKQWPNSKPRTMPRDTASYNSYLLRFLEQFLLLREVLLRLINL
jgi:nitrous oxidase accessory protein NosD